MQEDGSFKYWKKGKIRSSLCKHKHSNRWVDGICFGFFTSKKLRSRAGTLFYSQLLARATLLEFGFALDDNVSLHFLIIMNEKHTIP